MSCVRAFRYFACGCVFLLWTGAASAESASADAAAESRSPYGVDDCQVTDACIDQYLWSLYERTPKFDAIKVSEKQKVTVKRKGKTRTVVKTLTRIVDEDFTWKDFDAAEKAGLPPIAYVIGGMWEGVRYQFYESADGHVLFMASEQAFWRNFCDGLDRMDLFDRWPGATYADHARGNAAHEQRGVPDIRAEYGAGKVRPGLARGAKHAGNDRQNRQQDQPCRCKGNPA